MNKEDIFHQTTELLAQHHAIWSKEILFSYPNHLASYELLRQKRLYRRELFEKINSLFYHSLFNCSTSFLGSQRIDLRRLKEKKQHEITRIAHLLQQQQHFPSSLHLIDLCGGMGHLANHLKSHLPFFQQATSFDNDEKLQQKGRELYGHHVSFKSKDISVLNALDFPQREPLFLCGLHSCGALSLKQLQLSKEIPASFFLNVGCCYHKLKESECNLSQMAKDNFTFHNNESLTLATRGHEKESPQNRLHKIRVKRFRYTFYLLGLRYFPHLPIQQLRSSPATLYKQSFTTYVQEQLKRLSLPPEEFSETFLEHFFKEEKNKKEVKMMIHLGEYRKEFGKLLELQIVLDRYFWVQESTRQNIQLKRIFDPQISPRSLAIF